MSEDSSSEGSEKGNETESPVDGPVPYEELTDPAAVDRRLWVYTIIVSVSAIVISAFAAGIRMTLGILLGSGLAILNFRWLNASLRSIVLSGKKRIPGSAPQKFILRWLVIGASAFAASRTGWFDTVGILAGLFIPAVAAMLEAFYLTFKMLTGRR